MRKKRATVFFVFGERGGSWLNWKGVVANVNKHALAPRHFSYFFLVFLFFFFIV